jgi:hypothetical protein
MGANLIVITSTLLLPSFQHDTTDLSEQPSPGVAYERLSDLLGYNRVQGLSLGLGYQARLPGAPSASAFATIRYGMSDERMTWRLSIIREFRRGSLRVSGYYDIADVDPVSPGRTFGNTVNGLFAGHDNGDYALARGGSVSWDAPAGAALTVELGGRIERHSSATRAARSAVNDFLGGDGLFPPNPPVTAGTFGGGSVALRGRSRTKWNLTLDILGGRGHSVARLFGDVHRTFGSGPGIAIRLKAGAGTEPALPQTLFRLGGLNTVRGFEYATLRAPAFWTSQIDLVLLGGRVRPVVFLDVGQASRLSQLTSSTALAGAGAGVSLFKGLIRFDVSRPVSPDISGKLRFDVVIQGSR